MTRDDFRVRMLSSVGIVWGYRLLGKAVREWWGGDSSAVMDGLVLGQFPVVDEGEEGGGNLDFV